jgi:hypothetical protein
LQEQRKDHDLVFVYQRGTGESNGLNCEVLDDPKDLTIYFEPLFPNSIIRTFREELQTRRTHDATPRLLRWTILTMFVRHSATRTSTLSRRLTEPSLRVYMRQHPQSVQAVFTPSRTFNDEKFNQTTRIQLKATQPQAYNFGLLVKAETAVRLIAIP